MAFFATISLQLLQFSESEIENQPQNASYPQRLLSEGEFVKIEHEETFSKWFNTSDFFFFFWQQLIQRSTFSQSMNFDKATCYRNCELGSKIGQIFFHMHWLCLTKTVWQIFQFISLQ